MEWLFVTLTWNAEGGVPYKSLLQIISFPRADNIRPYNVLYIFVRLFTGRRGRRPLQMVTENCIVTHGRARVPSPTNRPHISTKLTGGGMPPLHHRPTFLTVCESRLPEPQRVNELASGSVGVVELTPARTSA